MTLADEILAARGTQNDIMGIATSISKGIEKAERFVLHDDVVVAGYQLIQSKPRSLLDALPMCRMPYPTMWIEWNGGLAALAGWSLYPATERAANDYSVKRPEPLRMGCLIEGLDKEGQRGSMSWAWVHRGMGVNVCGISVHFDWRADGDVTETLLSELEEVAAKNWFLKMLTDHWIDRNPSDQVIKETMSTHTGWDKLANDPVQVEAVRGLIKHEAPWLSNHARGLIEFAMESTDGNDFMHLLKSWEGDITGEAPFIEAVMLMLNSRNALDQEINDLSKLNKARGRRGKSPLLSHTVTRLHLSQARARAGQAQGFSREAMRRHMVRGHFKLRKSGVYWWSPFMRGDVLKPGARKQYDVSE